MDKRTRNGRVNPHPGVREHSGRCQLDYTDPVTGKRRQPVTEFPFTKAGIRQAIRERNRLLRTGVTESVTVPTFAQLAQTWLDTGELRPSARRTSKSRLNNHVMDLIGADPVDCIRFDSILQVQKNISHLAPKTRLNILGDAKAVFNLAIASGYISENPVKKAPKIKNQSKKVDPYTRDERDRMLAEMTGNTLLFYTIRFFDGLRPGEVIALQWSDYKNGVLTVDKEIVEGERIPSTKTHVSREVKVHSRTAQLLKANRGIAGPIFVNQYGDEYQRPESFAESFNRIRERLEIPYRSPYNVRHTCATMMLEAGCKPGYCAKRLGHSLQMFFNTYADWIDADESETQHKIWEAFG